MMLCTLYQKRPVVLASPKFLSDELAGHVDHIPASAMGCDAVGGATDFLLIIVPENDAAAGQALDALGGDPEDLVLACRQRDLPIVFWALGVPGISEPWISLCRAATLCYGADAAARKWINTVRNDNTARLLEPGAAPRHIQPIRNVESIQGKVKLMKQLMAGKDPDVWIRKHQRKLEKQVTGELLEQLAIAKNPHTWIRKRQKAHRLWRRKMTEDCWENRIAHIRHDLGRAPVNPWPLVTVYVLTIRPHLVDSVVETFIRQTYPNLELVIVFHSNDPKIIRHNEGKFEAHKNIRFLRMPQSATTGCCLNAAIDAARGLYSMKMDDDDFYAPNYVLDMMLPLRAIDVDIFSKCPAFIFFEGSNETWSRLWGFFVENSVGSADDIIHRNFWTIGSTLSGRTQTLRQIQFSEASTGAADETLYEHSSLYGAKIGVWDIFNFCVFRSADKNNHTARMDDEVTKKRSRFIGVGKQYLDFISL